MKYLVAADLHLDFWEENRIDYLSECADDLADLDLLLIAGDLTNKPKVRWDKFLRKLVEMTGSDVVKIFPGNHDFYNACIDEEYRLEQIAKETGAEFVNEKSIDLGKTRFICATLWTDFELGGGRSFNEAIIPIRMNDYRAIRHAGGGYRRCLPKDTIGLHYAHRKFIAEALQAPFDGEKIVVTHHAPHPDVLRDYSENLDAAYASDLTDLIARGKPDKWLFGHSHDASNVDIQGCRIENVSIGYPGDQEDPAGRIRSLIRQGE